jgi:hypothetical protein
MRTSTRAKCQRSSNLGLALSSTLCIHLLTYLHRTLSLSLSPSLPLPSHSSQPKYSVSSRTTGKSGGSGSAFDLYISRERKGARGRNIYIYIYISNRSFPSCYSFLLYIPVCPYLAINPTDIKLSTIVVFTLVKHSSNEVSRNSKSHDN